MSPFNTPDSDYLPDFQTTDFESDVKIAITFFADIQDRLKINDSQEILFRIGKPRNLAGWSFSTLFLAAKFVKSIYEQNSYEIEQVEKVYAAKAKYYEGDLTTAKFVSWLNSKLRASECKANVKTGEEMAQVAYGEGAGGAIGP